MITQDQINQIIQTNSKKINFFESSSKEILDLINKEIENYKKIMKLAKVPQFIIDNPQIVNQKDLITEADFRYAKEFLDKRNK